MVWVGVRWLSCERWWLCVVALWGYRFSDLVCGVCAWLCLVYLPGISLVVLVHGLDSSLFLVVLSLSSLLLGLSEHLGVLLLQVV